MCVKTNRFKFVNQEYKNLIQVNDFRNSPDIKPVMGF